MTIQTRSPTKLYAIKIDPGPAWARALPVPIMRPVPSAPPISDQFTSRSRGSLCLTDSNHRDLTRMKTTLELLSRNLVRSSLLDGSNVLVVILIAALRDLRIGASFLVGSHDEDGTTRCSRCGGLWGNLEKKCDQIWGSFKAGPVRWRMRRYYVRKRMKSKMPSNWSTWGPGFPPERAISH